MEETWGWPVLWPVPHSSFSSKGWERGGQQVRAWEVQPGGGLWVRGYPGHGAALTASSLSVPALSPRHACSLGEHQMHPYQFQSRSAKDLLFPSSMFCDYWLFLCKLWGQIILAEFSFLVDIINFNLPKSVFQLKLTWVLYWRLKEHYSENAGKEKERLWICYHQVRFMFYFSVRCAHSWERQRTLLSLVCKMRRKTPQSCWEHWIRNKQVECFVKGSCQLTVVSQHTMPWF